MTNKLATFKNVEREINQDEHLKMLKKGMEIPKKKKSAEEKLYLVLYSFPSTNSEDDHIYEIYTGRTNTYNAIKDTIINDGCLIDESLVIVETVTLGQALSEEDPKKRMSIYNFMKYIQESDYYPEDSFDIDEYVIGDYEEE